MDDGEEPDTSESYVPVPMRLFLVTKATGERELVHAHYYDVVSSPAGHLIFVTLDGQGTTWHRYAINARMWVDIVEEFEIPVAKGIQ